VNGEKLLTSPVIALGAITHVQATFTIRELALFVRRHSNGKEQFDRIMAAVLGAPELVDLGKDRHGEDRFTCRDMLETERRLERAISWLEAQRKHAVRECLKKRALAQVEARGTRLSREQDAAFEYITGASDLGTIVGYAGTGKSALLGVARAAWETAGYLVLGATLSGIAAEMLEAGSGISSRTIASIEYQWAKRRELLTPRHVIVVDEAGMIGSRQMERVTTEAARRGAKVVLVGDPVQLQAIEAGAAFRLIAEWHGSVEITDIRRQRDDWQQTATCQLATGRTADAVMSYERRGCVHVAETRDEARGELIYRWECERADNRSASRIILTHTNEEVRVLNSLAREVLRRAGDLGLDATLETERGRRQFAAGDRIMFLRNERSLGVKNGSLGYVKSMTAGRVNALLDNGRAVAFNVQEYWQFDHGYAATIHKAQGVTVDRAHVLATPGLDRHAAYVALSRHRDGLHLHYGQDDFPDKAILLRTVSRDRSKEMVSDYTGAPAGPRTVGSDCAHGPSNIA
jgi:Ti-type conjugative transfer relaxase TraA